MGNENMFNFGANYDGHEEEGVRSRMDNEARVCAVTNGGPEHGDGTNTQAARYPGSPPRKQVTIEGTCRCGIH